MKILDVRITPIAVPDVALLNTKHVHGGVFLRARLESALPDAGGLNAPTALADHQVVDVVCSAFEIACLDLQGKAARRPSLDLLGEMCRAAGLGVGRHSNSHLGISLAAMCHVAAATPNLTFAADTHYPRFDREIVKGGRAVFRDGMLRVPEGPGLGVELDALAVTELHDLYLARQVNDRDDTDEMLKYVPDYVRKVPRW